LIAIFIAPLWYIPHVSLQRVLSAIEIGLGRRSAAAWAVMLVLGKLAPALAMIRQFTM
jgi:hypothetical protein